MKKDLVNAPFTTIPLQGIRGVFSPAEINVIFQLTERWAAQYEPRNTRKTQKGKQDHVRGVTKMILKLNPSNAVVLGGREDESDH